MPCQNMHSKSVSNIVGTTGSSVCCTDVTIFSTLLGPTQNNICEEIHTIKNGRGLINICFFRWENK